jgi:hypothetical protein
MYPANLFLRSASLLDPVPGEEAAAIINKIYSEAVRLAKVWIPASAGMSRRCGGKSGRMKERTRAGRSIVAAQFD